VTFGIGCVHNLQTMSSSMTGVVGFAVGFVTGWVARSTVESSRAAAVGVASTATELLARMKRAAAVEGDYLEDFVAEVRSRIRQARGWSESAANGNGHNGAAATADGGVP
jgi:hypothetical protein